MTTYDGCCGKIILLNLPFFFLGFRDTIVGGGLDFVRERPGCR
jgi:hypothetical protein